MSETVSEPHVLVVELEDPLDRDSVLMWVEHPDCPSHVWMETPGDEPDLLVYDCLVGFCEEGSGLYEFEPRPMSDQLPLPPGRYEIEGWCATYPGGPWGATEHDAGLRWTAAGERERTRRIAETYPITWRSRVP